MKDGIIRPDVVTGCRFGSKTATDYQQKTADSIYDYFKGILDSRSRSGRTTS